MTEYTEFWEQWVGSTARPVERIKPRARVTKRDGRNWITYRDELDGKKIIVEKEFQPRHRSGCASEFGYAGGQVEHHYQFGIDLGGGVVDAYPARVKGLLQRRELWTQALTLPSSARAGDRCGRESWCPRWYLPLCRCTERQGRTGCCHRCL